MRGASSLLIRWICSLALIVAAMPIMATEAPCAMAAPLPVAAPEADCGMPCCEHDEPKAKVAHCGAHAAKTLVCCAEKTELRTQSYVRHELTDTFDPCKCEIKAMPSAPIVELKAVVPSLDAQAFVAPLPAALPELPSPLEIAEPGIFGADSGPPAAAPHRSDFGRAPPFARA